MTTAERQGVGEVGFAERAFGILVIVVATGGAIPLLETGYAQNLSVDQSNPVTFWVWILFYLVALALVLPRRRAFGRAVLSDWPVLGVVLLALGSTLWSTAPDLTIRRSLALAGTCVVGWYFAARYQPAEFFSLVAIALALAAVGSAVLAVASPIGVTPPSPGVTYDPGYDGAWRGIYATKNLLAQVMTLATLVLLLAIRSSGAIRWLLRAGLASSVAAVVFSRSATGLMMIFLLVLLVPSLGVRGRRGYVLLAAASAVAAAVTGLVLFSDINVDILLRMLGRDATLTGRTAVWSAVVDMIREHPWFGWGHGAFWRDWGGAGSNYVLRRAGWNPGYAHNGFLDQGVELGVVGVAALFVALANTGLKAFVWARRAPATWLRLWPLGFIVFAVIANLTEGGLVQQNNYMWLLFVTVSTSLGRDPAAGWIAKAQERLLPPIPSAGERWPTVPPSLRPLHWGWRRGA